MLTVTYEDEKFRHENYGSPAECWNDECDQAPTAWTGETIEGRHGRPNVMVTTHGCREHGCGRGWYVGPYIDRDGRSTMAERLPDRLAEIEAARAAQVASR